jgi:para-nitrobenzyl esterase
MNYQSNFQECVTNGDPWVAAVDGAIYSAPRLRRKIAFRLRETTIKRLGQTVLAGVSVAALAVSASAAKELLHEPANVTVDSGTLVGTRNGEALLFKGIPYAAAPVGALRWAPPEEVLPWTGPRAAKSSAPACPQKMSTDGTPNSGGVSGPISEDCLFLDVWAPRDVTHAPVMVWIYGGGNVYGSGSLGIYDGSAFVRDGVILVSINYRLGALGFFGHPALTKAAKPDEPLVNYGLLDQIAALRWVKRNIAFFGGDPTNVTVFGESAGGLDILALMAAPSVKDLFAKAIVESGGGWWPPVTLAEREKEGEALAVRAGAPAGANLNQLRALPVAALLSAANEVYLPAVDGRLLKESPRQAFAAGRIAHAPLLIGSNSNEASLMEEFGYKAAAIIATAPALLRAAYADVKDENDLAAALFTDAYMGAPARWVAAKASAGPSWLYRFAYVRDAKRATAKGVDHGSEIPVVFDSWEHVGALGEGLPVSDRDHAVTQLVHSCWVAFAKTGIPACAKAPAWPAYTAVDDSLMDFDISTRVRQHFRKPQEDAQEAYPMPPLDLGR